MQHITAIGFDLFETLIVVENLRREEAVGRLMQSLKRSGFTIADESFFPIYRAAARRFMEAAQHNGQETHNRFWVSTALQELGYDVQPDDTRIALAVERYFTAFTDYAVPIPGTMTMLAALKGKYRLGLLSNLTHAPAALHIIDKLGMAPFFRCCGGVGLAGTANCIRGFSCPTGPIRHFQRADGVFVGDNLEADIQGACAHGHATCLDDLCAVAEGTRGQGAGRCAAPCYTRCPHDHQLAGFFNASRCAIAERVYSPLAGERYLSHIDLGTLLFELLGLLAHAGLERLGIVEALLGRILTHVLRNLHGTECGPHRPEMGSFATGTVSS